MNSFLSVAVGAALGGLSRYYAGTLIQTRASTDFPVGTLAVNVVGSLLVGIILGFAARPQGVSDQLRLFLITGFCGGFTTFSAFSAETMQLLSAGRIGRAAAYIALSVGLAVIATIAGFASVSRFARP